MNTYFNLLRKRIGDHTQKISILELTKSIAIKAGYKRKNYIFHCGSQRIRTIYDKPFDDLLVARWILHYSGIFYRKISKYPDVEEYAIDIINETFYSVMNSLNLDMMKNNASINSLFMSAFRSRLYECLAKSLKNKEELLNTNRLISEKSLPYEQYDEGSCVYNNIIDENNIIDDLCYVDIASSIPQNKYSKRLLHMMLNSGKRVQFRTIDKYLHLDIEECTNETKKQIADSYNNIIDVFSTYVQNRKCRHITTRTLKYSFEKGVTV